MALANSYTDALEATTILTNTVGSESWLSLADDLKNASLIQATFLLDSSFNWAGTIASDTQELRWPRNNVTDQDGRLIANDAIPNALKTAVAMLAVNLVKSSGINGVSNNVKSIKVGPIAIGLDSTESVDEQIIPRYIISVLGFLGSYTGPSDSKSAYNIKAFR